MTAYSSVLLYPHSGLNKLLSTHLIEAKCIPNFFRIILQHSKDVAFLDHCLHALSVVLRFTAKQNVVTLADPKMSKELIDLLVIHNGELHFLESATCLLTHLCNEDEKTRVLLGQGGAVPALCSIIIKQSPKPFDIDPALVAMHNSGLDHDVRRKSFTGRRGSKEKAAVVVSGRPSIVMQAMKTPPPPPFLAPKFRPIVPSGDVPNLIVSFRHSFWLFDDIPLGPDMSYRVLCFALQVLGDLALCKQLTPQFAGYNPVPALTAAMQNHPYRPELVELGMRVVTNAFARLHLFALATQPPVTPAPVSIIVSKPINLTESSEGEDGELKRRESVPTDDVVVFTGGTRNDHISYLRKLRSTLVKTHFPILPCMVQASKRFLARGTTQLAILKAFFNMTIRFSQAAAYMPETPAEVSSFELMLRTRVCGQVLNVLKKYIQDFTIAQIGVKILGKLKAASRNDNDTMREMIDRGLTPLLLDYLETYNSPKVYEALLPHATIDGRGAPPPGQKVMSRFLKEVITLVGDTVEYALSIPVSNPMCTYNRDIVSSGVTKTIAEVHITLRLPFS